MFRVHSEMFMCLLGLTLWMPIKFTQLHKMLPLFPPCVSDDCVIYGKLSREPVCIYNVMIISTSCLMLMKHAPSEQIFSP